MRIKNKRLMIFGICCCLTAAAFAATDNTVELVRDPLKLVIYPKTGNFCLYHATVNDKNFYAPLYDDRAQSSVNVYSVQFNGKMFHLNNKSRKKILIEQLHDEIIVTFAQCEWIEADSGLYLFLNLIWKGLNLKKWSMQPCGSALARLLELYSTMTTMYLKSQ